MVRALDEHQLFCFAQWHRRLGARDWLLRERAGSLVRSRADAGPHQVQVGDDPQTSFSLGGSPEIPITETQ